MASTSGIEISPLKKGVQYMLQKSIVPPLTSQCCIFRVPNVLRNMKESAYTPLVISIGPFHRGKYQLQFMEQQKVRYLNHILQVYKMNLDTLLTFIKDSEESVRQSYGEFIKLESDHFSMMLLLDGVFIVEYFRKCCYLGLKDENDRVLNKPKLENSIRNDLILLENQLPFFFLESMYNLISPKDSIQHPFLKISCHFFNGLNKQKITSPAKVLHFTDLIRTFHLHRRNMEPIDPEDNEETDHISGYSAKELEESGINFNHRANNKETHRITSFSGLQLSGTQFNHLENKEETDHISVYSAKELEESGIHFKADSSKCLLDIKFTVNDGVFLIPRLSIDEATEVIFRNIMALEQHMYVNEQYICDYVVLMDTLINTYKDVELLVRKSIISIYMGDHDEEVAALFNNLGREIVFIPEKSYYFKLIQDLDKYYKEPRHKWRASFARDYASFKRDYLSSPWKIASVIGATLLIGLTLIQAVCSIIQVLPHKPK